MPDYTPNPKPSPPRGIFRARVDRLGWMSLPLEVHAYFTELGGKLVFVTSLDAATVRIYPVSVWANIEQTADAAIFIANRFGSESEINAKGRIRFGKDLRQSLQLDEADVFLMFEREHLAVYPEAAYAERKVQVQTNLRNDLMRMKRLGLR